MRRIQQACGIVAAAALIAGAVAWGLGRTEIWQPAAAIACIAATIAMGAFGMAGVLGVALVGGPRIGTQQGFHMSERLKAQSSETFERYAAAEETSKFGLTFRGLIPERTVLTRCCCTPRGALRFCLWCCL